MMSQLIKLEILENWTFFPLNWEKQKNFFNMKMPSIHSDTTPTAAASMLYIYIFLAVARLTVTSCMFSSSFCLQLAAVTSSFCHNLKEANWLENPKNSRENASDSRFARRMREISELKSQSENAEQINLKYQAGKFGERGTPYQNCNQDEYNQKNLIYTKQWGFLLWHLQIQLLFSFHCNVASSTRATQHEKMIN